LCNVSSELRLSVVSFFWSFLRPARWPLTNSQSSQPIPAEKRGSRRRMRRRGVCDEKDRVVFTVSAVIGASGDSHGSPAALDLYKTDDDFEPSLLIWTEMTLTCVNLAIVFIYDRKVRELNAVGAIE